MELIEKNAIFTCDKEGIIILTDIEGGPVKKGEVIYDGKNVVVLNRNGKEYYGLKNVPLLVRKKFKDDDYATIFEKNGKDIRTYKLKISMVKDLGLPDDYEENMQKIIEEMKKLMSEEEFKQFQNDAIKIYTKVDNNN